MNRMILVVIFSSFLLSLHSAIFYLVKGSDGETRFAKWESSSISVMINAGSSGNLTNADTLTELNAAFDQWDQLTDSSIQITRNTTNLSPVLMDSGNPDFINYVSFTSSSQFNPGVIGLTMLTFDSDTKAIVDADVQFNQAEFQFVALANGPSDVANKKIVLRNVATHEFGHLLGLDHSPIHEFTIDIHTIPESTMFPFFSDKQGSLEMDDKSGVSWLYPSASNIFKAQIQGQILNGEILGDYINGAHVIAWDHLNSPPVAISSISGYSTTGILLNGDFKVHGLPAGDFKIYTEPFPITANNGSMTIQNNITFLNQAATPALRASWIAKLTSFPSEFYNGVSESQYEVGNNFDTATDLHIDALTSANVKVITNKLNPSIFFYGSEIKAKKEYIYANGQTFTQIRFTPKDSNGNLIAADLSSRLKFTVTTGSFSSLTTTREIRPVYDPGTDTIAVANGESVAHTYTVNLYSTDLKGNKFQENAGVNVYVDSTKVFNQNYIVHFEKAHPTLSEIEFIPDISLYSQNESAGTTLPQSKKDVFADGIAPATWRIRPKFSNQSDISTEIQTTTNLSWLSADPLDAGITTMPIISLGANLYQTTMTNSIAGVIRPIFVLDEVILTTQSPQDSIHFSSISISSSSASLSASTIHIKHPDISTTPYTELTIKPAFQDGSVLGSVIATSQFGIEIFKSDGTLSTIAHTPVSGPVRNIEGHLVYTSKIEASAAIETYTIRVSILGNRINSAPVLKVDVSDPQKTLIMEKNPYLLAGSQQTTKIEIFPRFSDGTYVLADLSKLIFLNTSNGEISNAASETATSGTAAIHPSMDASKILTLTLKASQTPSLCIVSGTIYAQGYQKILDTAQVESVLANPNLLRITLNEDSLSADGQSITTLTVTPLFPDLNPIGKEFSQNLLTASISDGVFLIKSPSPINPTNLILVQAGTSHIPFYNNQNGTYELSIRSSNYSTKALINFYIDNVLSLYTKEITYSVTGSADRIKTLIVVDQPVLYANGESKTRIDVYPRAGNGEPLTLSQNSYVMILPSLGSLNGALIRNSDSSFTQWIQSVKSTTNKTSEISVYIDEIKMTPLNPVKIHFVNLNVNQLVSNYSYPDQGLIDGFDLTILAQAIRNRICQNFAGTCTLDFNQDGTIDKKDMDILLDAYGKKTQ